MQIKHSFQLHFAHFWKGHNSQSPNTVKQLPIRQLLLFQGKNMFVFDPNPTVESQLHDYPLQFNPHKHFPARHIPFALHYFGHLLTAHTSQKFKGHVSVPSYPFTVMDCPGKRHNPKVFPTLIVNVFLVEEHTTQQHLNGNLEAAAPLVLKSASKHFEICPPFYPVVCIMLVFNPLFQQFGSMHRKLIQYLTNRQSERESFLQYPRAVLSQSHDFTLRFLQYQFEEQFEESSMAQPFLYPKLMKLAYVLYILLYHPVSYSNERVIQEIVGLFGETPAVISQLFAAFFDQCDKAVPEPPLFYKSIPGGLEHAYCLQTSALIQGPVIQEFLPIVFMDPDLQN